MEKVDPEPVEGWMRRKNNSMSERIERGVLVLADGTTFTGKPFGARGKTTGEAVFCTAMSGYQEIITDPSYHRQLITMTAPEIGNVGVNKDDAESHRIWASGMIIKNLSHIPSNYRSQQSLHSYLESEGVIGISGIDTRALTRRLRDGGSQMAILSTDGARDIPTLIEEAKTLLPIEQDDLVKEVSCKEPYVWKSGTLSLEGQLPSFEDTAERTRKIVVMDFGVKYQTLRLLHDLGCAVLVVPASTSATDILSVKPDGVLLSNGPGDPARCVYAIETVRALIGQVPIFGICLGHQILSLALGAKTRKMPFGHRGANQPVSANQKVYITSQNHGFEVLPEGSLKVTERNVSDDSVEGMEDVSRKVFSVQYHPEASPGPHDTRYLFQKFLAMLQ
jgi:carbamoyl-phosphate synthase small subunit